MTTPTTPCPGSGQRWSTGTGNPMCPACRTGWRTLGVPRPKGHNPVRGAVPTHAKPEGRAIYPVGGTS